MARASDRRPVPEPSPTSLWAPRGPASDPAVPPRPRPVPGADRGAPGEPESRSTGRFPAPPAVPPAATSPVAPTTDPSARPPVAASPVSIPIGTAPPTGPPTSPPPARVPDGARPITRPAGRGAFAILMAFLAGMLVVGSAFAAYAFGERGGGGSTASGGGLHVRAILDRAQPSVVSITTGTENSIFGGAGSGVVISADGLVLTNAHVIEGSGGTIRVRFNDGVMAEATIVGASKQDDLALIRADRAGLIAATLGRSADLRVGDDVVAIGNALALGDEPSVTKGIVSAKNRSISDGEISLTDLIQTDAAINPGNSGGPLVNAAGEVVGINTAIIDGAQSVGFSISIDKARELIPELEAGRSDIDPDQAVLGVATVTVDDALADELRTRWDVTSGSGALITQMDEGSAAAESGLQLGDVIVEIDGDPMRTNAEVSDSIRSRKRGDEVRIGVERAGERRSFDVTLGPR